MLWLLVEWPEEEECEADPATERGERGTTEEVVAGWLVEVVEVKEGAGMRLAGSEGTR